MLLDVGCSDSLLITLRPRLLGTMFVFCSFVSPNCFPPANHNWENKLAACVNVISVSRGVDVREARPEQNRSVHYTEREDEWRHANVPNGAAEINKLIHVSSAETTT